MSGEYPRAEFMKSAGTSRDFPGGTNAEYCVVGRSNVGKSSFINHVFGDRHLAKVSRTPGKTTLANFYQLDNGTGWVDLPGYGYARTSRTEGGRLASLVRDFCTAREQLRGIMLLLDIRHPGLSADAEAWEWLCGIGKPLLIVLTKSDKVTTGRVKELAREHLHHYDPTLPWVPYSIVRPNARAGFWTSYSQWTSRAGSAGARVE